MSTNEAAMVEDLELESTTDEQGQTEFIGTATYSPEDNKLRLYPFDRLDDATYSRVKAAGFSWAPKQELFVAPMWTPSREDLLMELCGEIGDEGKSLAERAAERADRFERLSSKRARDAAAAHNAVGAIGQRFEHGQPIIIGHHSEKRARKDKERMENSMRKAISMWESSAYWEERAAGAMGNAAYKELPAVRFRRLKGLESDLRKKEKDIKDAETWIARWSKDGLTKERAVTLANYDSVRIRDEGQTTYTSTYSHLEKGTMTPEAVRDRSIKAHQRDIEWANRWANHYRNRIAYEKAMLQDSGAVVLQAQQWDIQPGGRVLVGTTWYAVVRVTRKDGKVLSVRTVSKYGSLASIEQITGYEPPTNEQAAAAKQVTKLGPIVNFRSEGCIEMTAAEWKRAMKCSDSSYNQKIPANDAHGTHRRRATYRACAHVWVFITDEKEVLPPPPAGPTRSETIAKLVPEHDLEATEAERVRREAVREASAAEGPTARDKARELKDALKGGVQVVSANQLFPTPSDLAARMVELADIHCNHYVLEPSAGTGRLLEALPASIWNNGEVHAVEISEKLAQGLADRWKTLLTSCADFLEWDSQGITFDRILMNPPFERGDDIRHILKAHQLLKPGGVLVAICAGGPRQKEALEPLADLWEPLPAGTFQESGTNVNTVLLTILK